ncbi:MAG TPA: ATP-binding protein [Verrucomicrobiae bacterium]|jgi:signal transduction histidine kinase|nr:ATP-binding protein [Verrucomicrobiae bacterium]
MTTRRSWLVYGMLGVLWALLLAWQVIEHMRIHDAAQRQLINRGRDISTTCGVLMRSRGFFGVISKERLESALNALVHNTNELESVVLLNAAGQTVAQAGAPFEFPSNEELRGGVRWQDRSMTLEIPVDLGTNVTPELAQTNLELVIPEESLRAFRTNRPPRPTATNDASERPREFRRPPDLRFNRPPWMNEEEYRALLQKAGVHSFVIVMSADPVVEATQYDLLVRAIIAILGSLGAAGFGLAWRNMTKTSELQLRLVRASELNTHLKEMNLAAAGLAHETRNPLNIIRGLAHLIAKNSDASPEIREKSGDIINQTDRVTAQLNEFINYSRPREVRRAPTDLAAVVNEVARTLAYDIEEKKINFVVQVEPIIIEADEQLLRQTLFNLALNAIQAVPAEGSIRIRASRRNNEEGFIEISDSGPGVAPENRAEIFKPYFTTNEEGTGLGLSIVQQIVLAHGWEIVCLPHEPKGALFRISHLKLKG